MNYDLLGKSDLRVSKIGFGCMSLGADHNANAKLLHEALDGGINFFDTADIYSAGDNEITVGKAFNASRDKVVIATKVGNVLKRDGNGFDWNPTKSHILQSIEESLRRLQTDYIDLYQLHGGTIQDAFHETIDAFELLKRQGKIRHYGISSIRPNVIREYIASSSIVSVMMQYSILDRRPEETCLDLLDQHNIGVLVRGSLAKGLLADKSATPYLNHSTEAVEDAQKIVRQLSDEKRTKTETAIQFVLNAPAVKSAIVGIRTQQQLHACLNATDRTSLTKGELEALRNAVPASVYEEHR